MTRAQDLTWRPLTAADAAELVDLRAASEALDRTGEHFDEADVLEELADPNLDLELDTIGGCDGDELVAFAIVSAATEVRDVDRVMAFGTVRPSHRRRGIGGHLLEWSAERAASKHAERHPGTPGEVHLSVLPTNPGQLALAEAAGFAPVRRFHVMHHPLESVPDRLPAPPGLRLRAFDVDLDQATRLARNAAFADHWGSVDRDEVVWRQWFTGQRAFRPGVSFLLVDDDHSEDVVVGFVLSYEYEAESAAEGVRQVWLGQIGVRPEWRGRGAAKALMAESLAAYHEAGYDRAGLDVDTENTLGALRLYEGTGWTTVQVWVAYARPVAEPNGSPNRL